AGGQADAPARLGIFAGVVEQVGHDLGQAGGGGVHDGRPGRQLDGQGVSGGFDVGPAGLQGVVGGGGQVQALPGQVDLARGDARHVHEVVDQPRQVVDLAVQHGEGLGGGGGVAEAQAEDLHGVADGGQGVAQLVGEHGEEVVLAAVGVLEGGL